MEENNKQDERIWTENNIHHGHIHWKECLGMLIAAFLGGFLAMYFVADQIFDRHYHSGYMMPNRFDNRMMKDFDRMYENEQRMMKRDFDNFNNFDRNFDFPYDKKDKKILSNQWFPENNRMKEKRMHRPNPMMLPDFAMDNVKIRTKIDDDFYKVIVGLNAFQGDEKKIKYNVSNRKLTVFGNSSVKDSKFEQDISFSQDFILPPNADVKHITRETKNNRLIIKVPLKH